MLFIDFVSKNWGTLLVMAIILAAVIPMVVGLIRDKKQGKSSCSCGCSGCPMSGKCHKTENSTEK